MIIWPSAGIPFTQYMRPDGREVPVWIERPAAIVALAQQVIDAGGWFEAEHLPTGHVSLTACAIVDDEPSNIAIQVLPNGPGVPDAVDALVKQAAKVLL